MTTLVDPPPVQTRADPAARLRATMAAVKLSITWLGIRKTLSPEQRAQAAERFGAPFFCCADPQRTETCPMTQHDLNCAVASRTGESLREISRRGFIPLTRVPVELDPDPPACDPVDWDALDRVRIGILFPQRARPASAF